MAAPRNPIRTYPWQWLFWPLTWLLSKLVRQDPSLVVMTSFHGDGYRGNTRRLFEWLHSDTTRLSISDKKVVWLTRNKSLVRSLNSRFGANSAVYAHSFRGATLLAKSRVALLTHGTSDYPFMYIPPRTHVIQTYHGLPTKRGEFMRLEGQADPGPIASYFLNRRFQPIDTFLSTSEFVSGIFSRRFGLDVSRFLPIGFPVYDELVARHTEPGWLQSLYKAADSKTRLILYAPTFRYKTATQLFPFQDMDTGNLARFLEQHNLVIAIRTHPNDNVIFPDWFRTLDRIVIATDKVVEHVNDLIVHSSSIITDYSSIYLEGLLRDIPPVFVPYDLNDYERGFPFEYSEVTPGPKVASFAEWKEAITQALDGAKSTTNDRERVRRLFFENVDAESTVRLWEFILRL